MTEIKIYVVRHGETLLNSFDRMQGWVDSDLTAKGRQQAVATGKRLQHIPFDYVCSSDLGRAIETRDLILDQLPHQPKILAPNKTFREVCFGYYEGLNAPATWQAVAQATGYAGQEELIANFGFPKTRQLMHESDPAKMAETYDQVIARWQHGFDVIHEACPDQATVLLITHGTFIRTLADYQGINIVGNFPLNGSISIVEETDDAIKLVSYNQTADRD
ncbi:histidine phosphatase family protein [Levilactobacillus tujiorum]|uniref:Histidine phosphatase family protein n=1 Tax=Levilactobacillus tujiorum TaxID=2912243 RepID=A0ABX1L713_9LACO|nr:histidine phosphatase family protein [Levilactobacillus tujiorum]MCH5464783.1 histidine phosphatase family protein [Levilactobacillus tujiorum]NLR12111.1 histidine phosphatase family protein [Lactobacillus sp. HBUAS51387]NLR29762.1 histidine phosphatase family protein [Levilactobacillus tujiorum]